MVHGEPTPSRDRRWKRKKRFHWMPGQSSKIQQAHGGTGAKGLTRTGSNAGSTSLPGDLVRNKPSAAACANGKGYTFEPIQVVVHDPLAVDGKNRPKRIMRTPAESVLRQAAEVPEMKGWLHKWTNYLKGYQKRWFVLNNGLLSYYRNYAEMLHTCRGTISLRGASIHSEDTRSFIVSNGGTQVWHLIAQDESEKKRWVEALESAKEKELKSNGTDSDDEEPLDGEGNLFDIPTTVKQLNLKLDELTTCQDLISKNSSSLLRSISELENPTANLEVLLPQLKERTTLFRITMTAALNSCSEFVDMAQTKGKVWQRLLTHEQKQRCQLQEMVETLARQHSHLEQKAIEHSAGGTGETPMKGPPIMDESEEDDEFFDAEPADMDDVIIHMAGGEGDRLAPDKLKRLALPSVKLTSASSAPVLAVSEQKESSGEETSSEPERMQSGPEELERRVSLHDNLKVRMRRTRIPDKPNYPINLWNIMKNCIGKDLSKIPMPVNFSEPLSMLQRLCENYEYSELLDQAAICSDPWETLALIAAFTISSYASTAARTGKPFNPLLGETYEFDRRDDYGWRTLTEQVSHHPPVAAQYTEGKGWKVSQEFTLASKFRGKYLQVIPLGTTHVDLIEKNHHITYHKVTTTVHNIIVGKLWVDNHGEMDIINHSTGDACHVKFIPYSYFSREGSRRVTGTIKDKDEVIRWVISGTWDESIEAAQVLRTSTQNGRTVLDTGPPKLLWRGRAPPVGYERYYNMGILACQLNEPEDGVAPTDCRFRPDQRMMEEGLFDEANTEKLRLEEKQRAARRLREQEVEEARRSGGTTPPPYAPLWFRPQVEPVTGMHFHQYSGGYWEAKSKRDWAMCPDIF